MKVSFIFDECYLGGTESAIKNRMDHLKDNGVDCEIIFLRPKYEEVTFKNHKYHVAESFLKIKSLVKDSDIIDVLAPLDFVFNKVYKMGKPVIHECHFPGYFSYLPLLDEDKIKAVIFPSKWQMSIGMQYVPEPIPSYYLYNCLGSDFLQGEAHSKEYTKKIILWVGRIEERKNWKFLLELSLSLPENYLIRVVTDEARSVEYSHFIDEILDLNLDNKIEVVSNCPYNKMLSHYRDAALKGCYLSSAYSESFGMTVIESQYAGCPVVLTDLPVFREVAGDFAEYYAINNVRECIDKIEEVCSPGDLRRKMVLGGRDRYNNMFEPGETCKSFINIIKSIKL